MGRQERSRATRTCRGRTRSRLGESWLPQTPPFLGSTPWRSTVPENLGRDLSATGNLSGGQMRLSRSRHLSQGIVSSFRVRSVGARNLQSKYLQYSSEGNATRIGLRRAR